MMTFLTDIFIDITFFGVLGYVMQDNHDQNVIKFFRANFEGKHFSNYNYDHILNYQKRKKFPIYVQNMHTYQV